MIRHPTSACGHLSFICLLAAILIVAYGVPPQVATGRAAEVSRPQQATATRPAPTIGPAAQEPSGVLRHTIVSEYQAGPTEIRILLPERPEPGRRYPAVYVLPVEAGDENRWGNGLQEVIKQDLHRKHPALFVAPTFSHLPWYADHPSEPSIRQETYFLNVVLPTVEQRYPVQTEPSGRLLLGFSKSGYGAWSLLLRHPAVFGRAAAWDAPLAMEQPNRFGMDGIYGTQENFDRYRITRLLDQRAGQLRGPVRLFLLGYGNFRDQHEQTHALLQRLGVPHHYEDGPPRPHHWSSGWVAPAVRLLLEPARKESATDLSPR
jgi:S-formylglutathione hydrolase FrmB